MEAKKWTVQLFISEDDGDERTLARAILSARGSEWHESVAVARRNPNDLPVPEIGDDLAAGRAPMDLAAELIGDATEDVAQFGRAHAARPH